MGGSNKPQGQRNLLGGSTNTFSPGQDFWSFNPRNIAKLNPNLRAAGMGAQGLFGAGQGALSSAQGLFNQLAGGNANLDRAMNMAQQYSGGKLPSAFGNIEGLLGDLRGTASRQVTGANLDSDPALAASRRNFALNQRGNIQSAAARMGLGRSNTAINAEAMARAASDVPFIQDALGREERGIGREMGAIDRAIASQLGMGQSQLSAHDAATRAMLSGAAQDTQRTGAAAQGLAGVGSQQFNQMLNAVQSNAQVGSGMRDIQQEILDAPYEEQQRLYAEALNSMYGPLGMIGSMLGASTTSSKK